MADLYSVVYDPVAQEPFGIIKKTNKAVIAYPVHKSANNWASEYNGGKPWIPYGMTSTDFVEMACDFVSSFRDAFAGSDRASRRADVLTNNTQDYKSEHIVYGSNGAGMAKRQLGKVRKVMPVIAHAQREVFRSRLIQDAIRNGKRWLRKDKV